MGKKGKIFIGVAWPYVNGDLHVGHLAGYLIPADVFARWARLKGYKVLMVSGTDCHGTPITVEADKKGITPYKLIEIYTPRIHKLIETYRISYDLFTTTTTLNHYQITQEFFFNLLKNGYIIRKKSLQYYSQKEKRFLPDRYVEGECPYCGAKDQRADQCEVCGRVLDFGELINPVSKLSKTPVDLKETEHYYIDFKKLQPAIKRYVQAQQGKWREWVWQETWGWLKEGLKARPITRDLDWGVPLPVDKIPKEMLIEGAENKRFYVWFDAVIGYFSAALEWAKKQGDKEVWKEFWLNKDCKHYYFMGQDNLAFHTIFWPGQLIGQKKGYKLPDFPVVNKYLNLEGEKFSKSRGVVVDSMEVAQKYGVAAVRFYILSILPENKQSSWQWSEFEEVVNANLVDNIGNLVQRVVSFYDRFLNQTIKEPNRKINKIIYEETKRRFNKIDDLMPRGRIREAFEEVVEYGRSLNKYLNETAPWRLVKSDLDKAERVIYSNLYGVYQLGIMLEPFIPQAAEKIHLVLGIKRKTDDKNQRLEIGRVRVNLKELPVFEKIAVKED